MAVAALAEPQTVKISSKRQITIPSQWYKAMEFGDYALCTWTENGLLLQPLDVETSDITINLLRNLIALGYEGEDLVDQYEALTQKSLSLEERMEAAERAVKNAQVKPIGDLQSAMRQKHGL